MCFDIVDGGEYIIPDISQGKCDDIVRELAVSDCYDLTKQFIRFIPRKIEYVEEDDE